MRTLLLFLIAFGLAGSLAKADTLNYKYTLHIDGVTLPGDGLRLPDITLAFLSSDDLRFGDPARYNFGDPATTNVVPLYLYESVSPNSPTYVNPFMQSSGFFVGQDLWFTDHLFMGDNFVLYDTRGARVLLPGPGLTVSGTIYSISSTFRYSDDSSEIAPTNFTLGLDAVPEPNVATLVALGLMGIAALGLSRKKHEPTIR